MPAERLKEYLARNGQPTELVALTADASTREYFRISWNGSPAVACVYPEPFVASEQTYLDTTRLFVSTGLPVARILDQDEDLGVIVQEDLGDRVLRDVMQQVTVARRSRLRNEAISLIARIQAATQTAYDAGSIASTLRFDTAKLDWELQFFKEHYFETYRTSPLSATDDKHLSDEFHDLAAELEGFASVLCHRDFHAANLMLDGEDRMRIIDHQDARIGSPSYDLVSLLLDRITDLPPREWLADKRKLLLDYRVKLGLPRLDEEEFAYQFRLQTIQRCLKAAGTFSYQSVNRGKIYFIPFILPMFRISHRAAESLARFPAIQEILMREIAESDA
ncbi:MAG: aminoglycoside phosphotransferase family protein [Pyrinomonadaceae bacterium]